jgi:hypothetical protein
VTDRRAPVKVALLASPLLVVVLVLHARGDAMAAGLGRAVSHWQYPERTHGPFQIRVPRRSDVDAFAARALEEFLAKAVKAHGPTLGIQAPTRPVTVVMLDADTEIQRFGSTIVDDLNPNQAVFDPTRRTIFVRTERKPQPAPLAAALVQATARLLLHDAGSARWRPWLTEGLAGRLEGTAPAEWRSLVGELPGVEEILNLGEADFAGQNRQACSRAARLLVAFLADHQTDKFLAYYKEEQAGLRPSFADRIGSPSQVEEEWKEWIQRLK